MIVIIKYNVTIVYGYEEKIHCVFDGTMKDAKKMCDQLNEKAKKWTYMRVRVKVLNKDSK